MPTVEISHNLDLGPALPEEYIDVARRQGEDPEKICADLQDFRDMIYGNLNNIYIYIIIQRYQRCFNKFYCIYIFLFTIVKCIN